MGENKEKGVSQRKIIIRVTLVLITLAALFVLVGVPWFFTSVVTTRRFDFPDSDLGKTPTIHQLAFDEIEFSTQDGITIRGWYIPAGSEADASPSGSQCVSQPHAQQVDTQPGEPDTQHATQHRQHEALGQKLSQKSTPSCAQRRPNRGLPMARGSAGEQQAGQIRRGDQEHEHYGTE